MEASGCRVVSEHPVLEMDEQTDIQSQRFAERGAPELGAIWCSVFLAQELTKSGGVAMAEGRRIRTFVRPVDRKLLLTSGKARGAKRNDPACCCHNRAAKGTDYCQDQRKQVTPADRGHRLYRAARCLGRWIAQDMDWK
jgi:hypothetical protein